MLSNSSFTCLELRRLYYAQVDGQSSQSSPAFYTPAFYPLSLPHPALRLFTHSLSRLWVTEITQIRWLGAYDCDLV